MGTIVREHTYVDGLPAKPSEVNDNEDVLYNVINGNLDWDNLDATLINVADGFVKLDGDAKVPNAQMAAVIDADTVDTKHYTDITDKITSDIATHAALANVHHTPTAALAHASLTGVGASDHHTKTTTLTHAALTSVGASDHHAKTTALAHSAITSVGASDHHTKTTTLADITPDYDSTWVTVADGATHTFTHSLDSYSFITVIKYRTGSGYSHTVLGTDDVLAWLDTQNTIQVVNNTGASKEIRVVLFKWA